MDIRRISVKNIRSHSDKTVDLSPDTTIFIGKNGAGKTSLLEAIYIALQGASFKGSDTDILRHEAPWYRIELLLADDTVRSVTFDPSRASGKKKFVVHEKTSYRLSPRDKYPVVLFEPEDLRLLHGSPSRRRHFIDHFIGQVDPTYSTIIRRYERALKQRNTLLKQQYIKNEDLFVWNIALSEYGAAIIDRRVQAIELLNKSLGDQYNQIANTGDDITAHYSHTSIDNSSQKFLKDLEMSLDRDKLLAYTSVGPHRHDVIFNFNNRPALSVASRGEVRSVMLSLKQIEASLIQDITGQYPIILLDDVFSELDSQRRASLLGGPHQKIVTSTEYTNSQSSDAIVVNIN